MPSTGIPSIERFVARLLIRRWTSAHPLETVPALLRTQQRDLLSMIQNAGERATTRVQIKRPRGLEESSTNYSLAMVADHLARVNHDIAATLIDLKAGRSSPLTVNVANYKPSPTVQTKFTVRDLDASIAALEAVLADPTSIRQSTVTHSHPWFGPLSATVWGSFGAFHQELHLKQAKAIVEGLGS